MNNDLYKIIDDFIHDSIIPLMQSLKAHIELIHNDSYHISPKILSDILNRLDKLRQDLLGLVNKTEEK